MSHTPVKDSVFELRTRMARMLSIVEITSQRNNPVLEYRRGTRVPFRRAKGELTNWAKAEDARENSMGI